VTRSRRAYLMIAVAMSFTLAATACSSGGGSSSGAGASSEAPGVTSDSITIGISLPLSGPAGPVCSPVGAAAHAWFAHVNSQGGINGRKIEENVLDDQYTAPRALANAKEFISKPVFAIFGGCGSPQPPAIQTVAKPAKVPYLFPGGSLPELSGDSNVFLALPSYDKQMGALTGYAEKKFGAGSVYVVSQQIPGIDSTTASITKAATDAGQTVLGSDVFTVGQADLGPTILKIKQAHPDYLAMNVSTDAARLIAGLIAQNALPSRKILGWSSILTAGAQAASKALPTDMLIAASATAAPDSPEMKTCADVMNAGTPNSTIDSNANYACAAAQAFTHALEGAGKNLTRDSFEKELLSWKNVTASPALPPLTYTNDDRSGATGAFAVVVSSGVVRVLDKLVFS